MDSNMEAQTDMNQRKSRWYDAEVANEEDWDALFEKTQQESMYLNLKLKEHQYVWQTLMRKANLKQNESETIIDCLKKMIDSMPVGTLSEDTHWIGYLKTIYYLLKVNKLSAESFEIILQLTEKKLAITYNKTSLYWKNIRQLEKKRELPDDVYVKRCIDTYKKQFSLPYMKMALDYEEFLIFAQEEHGIGETELSVISSLYEKNILEAERIKNEFWNCFDEKYHHVLFEEWVNGILTHSPQMIETAIALCDEAVVDEKESFCYHFVLAKTLLRGDVSEPSKREKLFKSLKRGIHLGRDECENTLSYFLDFTLQVASSYLISKECLELMDDIIDQFDFDDSVSNFLTSRKAIIFGLKVMIHNKKFPSSDYYVKIQEALDPVIHSDLDENVLESGKESVQDFELKRLELIKLALLDGRQMDNMSWHSVLKKWEEVCLDTANPEVILEYASFIRDHGSPEEAEDGYQRALSKMQSLNNNKVHCTYRTRRCELILMNKFRELLAYKGGKTDVVRLLADISEKHSFSSLTNNEKYYLHRHTQISDERVAQRVFDSTDSTDDEHGSSENLHSTKDVVPVTSDMKKLTVDQNTGSYDDGGYPVFLSNLQFKATKKDIAKAFKERGLDVVNIRMKITPKKTNYGYAVVELGSKEQAMQAIRDCDHMEILGRKTFVSEYKIKTKTYFPRKPEPTVLVISGLPQDWKNPKKIENALLPFGHIKSVEVQDKTATAKVEYHMSGDAVVGCMKFEEILVGTGVTIRMGYPGQKDATEKQSKFKPNRPTNRRVESHDNVKKNGPALVSATPAQSQGVKKEFKPKIAASFVPRQLAASFVPRQLRQQMKKKLDITEGSEADSSETPNSTQSSIEDSEDLGPSKEKKMKEASTCQGKNLSNSDFREMLKK